jgi:hypothetical protein
MHEPGERRSKETIKTAGVFLGQKITNSKSKVHGGGGLRSEPNFIQTEAGTGTVNKILVPGTGT